MLTSESKNKQGICVKLFFQKISSGVHSTKKHASFFYLLMKHLLSCSLKKLLDLAFSTYSVLCRVETFLSITLKCLIARRVGISEVGWKHQEKVIGREGGRKYAVKSKIIKVANSEMKFSSRAFSAKFQGFSRVFLTMLSKKYNYPHIDLAVPIHLSFCVLLEILFPMLGKEAAYHTTNDMLFSPHNNLIDPPPLRYRNKECSSTARPKIDV